MPMVAIPAVSHPRLVIIFHVWLMSCVCSSVCTYCRIYCQLMTTILWNNNYSQVWPLGVILMFMDKGLRRMVRHMNYVASHWNKNRILQNLHRNRTPERYCQMVNTNMDVEVQRQHKGPLTNKIRIIIMIFCLLFVLSNVHWVGALFEN